METKVKTTVRSIFHCSLERAFKTPILCDVTRIHTGYGLMPKVTHCTEDEGWGQPGASKKVFVAKSMSQPGGWMSVDHVVERVENRHWKIRVDQFQSWMLSFTRFEGEWHTREVAPKTIEITYNYTMCANNPLWYPFNWLFTKTFWRIYMKRVVENVRKLTLEQAPYLYD
jgi:hypothetical protein